MGFLGAVGQVISPATLPTPLKGWPHASGPLSTTDAPLVFPLRTPSVNLRILASG